MLTDQAGVSNMTKQTIVKRFMADYLCKSIHQTGGARPVLFNGI